MIIPEVHAERVKQELIKAGVTGYGLMKRESKYLPHIIHEDETIGGVVYGRYVNGSAMLVATNKRVFFLDRKPLFTSKDEVTYDVVSGVQVDVRGALSTVTLHTRIKDYTLKFVNAKCARTFVKFVEKRRLEANGETKEKPKELPVDDSAGWAGFPSPPFPFLSDEAALFLMKNNTGVLSSADTKGNVYGAAVYYCVDQLNRLFVLTKTGTHKYKNIQEHKQVAVTIFDPSSAESLQLLGVAQVETEQKIKDYVMAEMLKPRKYQDSYHLPPVTKLDAGAFAVIRITPRSAEHHVFSRGR